MNKSEPPVHCVTFGKIGFGKSTTKLVERKGAQKIAQKILCSATKALAGAPVFLPKRAIARVELAKLKSTLNL